MTTQMTINGQSLSEAEIATLRCAIVSYALDLNENILGEDEHGQVMMNAYKANLRSINLKFQQERSPAAAVAVNKLEEKGWVPESSPCKTCDGEGTIHDADFSNGDSDQQMFLMQDTMRDCPDCSKD